MALTITAGAARNSDANAVDTWAFDAGASPKGVFLLVASAMDGDPIGSVSYGGKVLTKLVQGTWSVSGHQFGAIFGYIGSDIPPGSNTFSVTTGAATSRTVVPVAVAAAGALSVAATDSKGTSSGDIAFTFDGAGFTSRVLVAGSIKSTSGTFLSPAANTTQAGWRFTGANEFGLGHETADATDARRVGFDGTWLCGAAGVILKEGPPFVQPTTVVVQVAVQTTGLTVAPGASTMLFPSPATRVKVAVQTTGLAVTATAQRQVALVGNGIETSEMTVGGTEGQVLTQHAKRPPTWEDGGGGGGDISVSDGVTTVDPASAVVFAGATVTDDGGGQATVTIQGAGRLVLADGITDPPEPVWTVDGTDFIYEEDMD